MKTAFQAPPLPYRGYRFFRGCRPSTSLVMPHLLSPKKPSASHSPLNRSNFDWPRGAIHSVSPRPLTRFASAPWGLGGFQGLASSLLYVRCPVCITSDLSLSRLHATVRRKSPKSPISPSMALCVDLRGGLPDSKPLLTAQSPCSILSTTPLAPIFEHLLSLGSVGGGCFFPGAIHVGAGCSGGKDVRGLRRYRPVYTENVVRMRRFCFGCRRIG